ncbi:LamB/YcsF family protein [Roseibaca sp. Y0-43]|uniref:LamB/YcsF family protein n=1 Tax=Roseibaca sp. Y0-43 TaxID=2816854 RepID=UPI001D0CA9FC|nr:5-oxoprolinase subunit PxpA [Roseibaca sp. Y0-43]MCC1480064.1 LamB/YcsF family protein [Roseibaca sp. Y0-43]
MMRVDLNADMGESFGPWPMGADTELLDIITSANIACGFHAGDPDVMAGAMALAARNGVGIGAHPGLPDLQGFGRRRMDISHDAARNLTAYQLGAAQAMARAAGGHVRHLKLHGAIANMAAEDEGLARACYEGALSVDPDLILMVISGTAQERAARALNARIACEIFADRAYTEEGLLMDRRLPGAVLHDPDAMAARVLAMVQAGAIITAKGTHLPARIDTICLHGDGPSAVATARKLRETLEHAGVTLAQFDGSRE